MLAFLIEQVSSARFGWTWKGLKLASKLIGPAEIVLSFFFPKYFYCIYSFWDIVLTAIPISGHQSLATPWNRCWRTPSWTSWLRPFRGNSTSQLVLASSLFLNALLQSAVGLEDSEHPVMNHCQPSRFQYFVRVEKRGTALIEASGLEVFFNVMYELETKGWNAFEFVSVHLLCNDIVYNHFGMDPNCSNRISSNCGNGYSLKLFLYCMTFRHDCVILYVVIVYFCYIIICFQNQTGFVVTIFPDFSNFSVNFLFF